MFGDHFCFCNWMQSKVNENERLKSKNKENERFLFLNNGGWEGEELPGKDGGNLLENAPSPCKSRLIFPSFNGSQPPPTGCLVQVSWRAESIWLCSTGHTTGSWKSDMSEGSCHVQIESEGGRSAHPDLLGILTMPASVLYFGGQKTFTLAICFYPHSVAEILSRCQSCVGERGPRALDDVVRSEPNLRPLGPPWICSVLFYPILISILIYI